MEIVKSEPRLGLNVLLATGNDLDYAYIIVALKMFHS